MKYASFKMWIADKYHYKDGYAIWLVVRKDNKRAACATESAAGIASFSHKNEIFNVVLAKNA